MRVVPFPRQMRVCRLATGVAPEGATPVARRQTRICRGNGTTRMKKSQIQQIKEGLAMRQKTYSGRLQPLGPKAPLPTRNAVLLSTVPASAKEKFNGGKDD